MKKLSKIVVTIMLLATFNSCHDEFLTEVPPGSASEKIFYNEKGIDALLTGTYSILRGSGYGLGVSWGASIQNWMYGSVASDDAYKGSDINDAVPINDIERWQVTTNNPFIEEKWKLTLGMGVDRANKTLRVIKKTEDAKIITAEQAKKYRAEIYFLRALFYFEARLVFDDFIPIITEDTPDPKLVKNVNAEGVVLTFIINDLKFALENLPASQAQVGRPTKYAAMALAARAYLQDLKYAEAKPLLDSIINSGKYSLMDKFIQNFEIATKNNRESIFEIQADVNDVSQSSNADMGIGLNFPCCSVDFGTGYGFHQTSQNLVNAYKVDADGLPLFDTFNSTDLKNDEGIPSEQTFVPAEDLLDPRLDFTLSRRGIPYKDWGINRGRDWIRDQANGGPYLPASKPFFKKAERLTLSTSTGWQNGINANSYRYLRYGHILLWRAEVAAFEGDLAKAKDLVNQIRTRAGNDVVMGKVKIYELPFSVYPWGKDGDIDFTEPAANYKIGLYTAFANKNDAMRAVQWEQRLEFATEGLRFFDLRRWDKLPAGMRVDMAATLNAFARGDERIRTFMQGATFNEKAKYMPVPQSQLDLQPGILEQNPDY